MIKALEVIADSSLSGAPRHVLTLLEAIDRKKFEPIVVCPQGWLANAVERVKIKVKRIGFKNFFDIESVIALRRFIKRERPDIIHSHGIRAGWLTMLATVRMKVRRVYSEHLYTEDYHLKNKLREYFQLLGLRLILRSSLKVVCPSRVVFEFLDKIYGRATGKLTVIADGIEDFKVESKETIPPTFGFIGSLNYHKGIYQLFVIINLVLGKKPAKFEIIGDGPLRGFVVRRAATNQSISFLGETKNISEHLGRWRAVLIPSLSESFGQVALEAAIARKPVVAFAVGGLKELVENGKSGILTKKGDVEGFANSVVSLIKDPKLAMIMGVNARKIYEREFTSEIMSRKMEKMYLEMAGKK